MSKLFKSFSEVSNVDLEFSDVIKQIAKELNDCFAEYKTYYGYYTNELREYINELSSDLFEDDNEDLHLVWFAKKSSVISLMNFLENYDMIVVKNGKPSVSQSNHSDVASHINKLFALCK